MNFDHYVCQCGYVFCVAEIEQARIDFPCPICHSPSSDAKFVKAIEEKGALK